MESLNRKADGRTVCASQTGVLLAAGMHGTRRMDNFEINKRIAEIENYCFEVAEKTVYREQVKYVRVRELVSNQKSIYFDFQPATDWGHGGPLLQEHKVTLDILEDETHGTLWEAMKFNGYTVSIKVAETPLKAAMLAIIAGQIKGS